MYLMPYSASPMREDGQVSSSKTMEGGVNLAFVKTNGN